MKYWYLSLFGIQNKLSIRFCLTLTLNKKLEVRKSPSPTHEFLTCTIYLIKLDIDYSCITVALNLMCNKILGPWQIHVGRGTILPFKVLSNWISYYTLKLYQIMVIDFVHNDNLWKFKYVVLIWNRVYFLFKKQQASMGLLNVISIQIHIYILYSLIWIICIITYSTIFGLDKSKTFSNKFEKVIHKVD